MTTALVVPVHGFVQVVDWDLGRTADPAGLLALQGAVGGYIEAINGSGWHAYVNEDGKMRGLEPNVRATVLAYEFGWNSGEVLLGPAVFLGTGNDSDEHDCPMDLILRAQEFPI